MFGPHRTAISVREDAKVPLVIETIEATDQDEGRFGQVIYKLDELEEAQAGKQVSSMFSIETVDGKGIISLINALDYEQKPLHQLRVLAIDRAIEHERLTATTSILVSVEDCEDQPPMFTFVPSITRIPENLAVGSPVVRVAAIDGDRGINNQIQYKLVSVNGQESGPERNLFTIDAESGQISVARELDRESSASSPDSWPSSASLPFLAGSQFTRKDQSSQPGSYVIQVQASELNSASRDNSVSTELTVILTDVNDEAPTFNQAAYFGEILENSTPENLVTFIANPSQLSQQLAPTNGEQAQPSAKVVDKDQGTNGTFTLSLEGEFGKLFEVWPREATNEANFMIKVSATQENGKFQLDFERLKSFEFTIVAKEKYNSNGPLRSNSVPMVVYLKDANDNYPQFESELYRVEIPENAIRGMHICAVKATDVDSGVYGSQGIRYTEIRGEKANKFKLDPLTGVITLKTNEHGFDRETIAQHHLIVEARDNNGSGNRNTTQLLIILTDVNDQRPKFMLDQYEAFIYENELDFQNPLQVQAVDNDAQNTPNSRITYSIVGGDPQQNFTIDPQTGRIRVKSSLVIGPNLSQKPTPNPLGERGEADIVLDSGGYSLQPAGLDFEHIAQRRDDTRQFNLTIKATDSGLPEPLSSTTHVVVLVYDKNDHAPVFTRNIYNKSIREDAKEGSQVIQVLAQDGDHSPTNSKITYRISSGASDKFVIDSDSGLISVANGANLDIDRVVGGQKRTNYLLNVIAFDGSFGPNQKSSSALVNITIIDVNNKPPEFLTLGASRAPLASIVTVPSTTMSSSQQQMMVVHVNEDAPFGLIVTRVVAMDLDFNAELRYSINYAKSEARNEDMVLVDPALIKDLFSIEQTDGTIKVAKQLDRETFDQVKLRLQVEDIAAQTLDQVAHTYLLVKITDVNDNKPTFKKPLYKAVVNENSISGTSVITLAADDRDLNKTLKYSLDGAPEMLRLIRINPRSGEVTVNDKIDRESYPTINVTVKAEDYGQPRSLTGTTQLLLTVRDENDNNPMFLNSTHQNVDQSQNSNPDQRPTTLKNHNMNDSLIYRHRSLGPNRYDTTTISSDSILELSNTEDQAQILHLPLLSPGSTAKIREDAPIGFQIAYVRAEDADVGNNGRVTYLIDGVSSGGKFRIDRDSGVISVAGPLDRESNKHYSLIIEACDNYDLGYSTGESRRAFTQVNIQITDVNDNVPIITTNLQPSIIGDQISLADRLGVAYPSYDDIMNSPGPYDVPLAECLFISEFQPLNEPILTITATDADDPTTQNGQMDLAIVNHLPQNELFGLVTIPTNREAATRISTERSTTIGTDFLGFGDLTLAESSSSASAAPVEVQQQPSDSRGKQNLGDDVRPSDGQSRPKRSTVSSYTIEPTTEVLLDGAHSPITTRQNTVGSHINLASSRLHPSARNSPLILVSDPLTNRIFPTTTGAPPASAMISATMSSIHHLGGQSLDAGEQQVHLVVTQPLKERVGNYSIFVRATDRGQPPLSSIKLINICVQDVNNHSPLFVRPPLNHTIRIMENATIGTFVTQVEATDSDHGLNGELQYSLKPTNIQNNNNDWQSFKIDRMKGIITTAKQFNRQVKKYYTLRVQAQDFGRPTALSSDIDINIMIVNSGQYQPEFDSQLQNLQFTENVAPGIEWFTLHETTNLDDDPALINANNHDAHGASSIPAAWLASPCYFIIDSDDHEQVFHLDRYTHRITNQKVIDREQKANFTLIVQATNNCNKAPAAPAYTRALETSRLASQNQASQSVNARAESSTTNSVIDYRGSDASGAEYSESRVRISRSSQSYGRNKSNNLDQQQREKAVNGSQHNKFVLANQAAVDSLLLGDKTLLKVFIKIKDVNDNAPRFTQRVYTGGITTEADFGTIFMIVQAIDADADANSQIVYSIVKPIKKNLVTSTGGGDTRIGDQSQTYSRQSRQKRATNLNQGVQIPTANTLVTTQKSQRFDDKSQDLANEISTNEGDDMFVINPQTGEISLNFDPQKHMKGYFEFEIVANDTDGLFDSAKVFIYLLRQDQRVKFVLRLTPQELRQRLNKFRSVFGNITGAIVNIDSYKYYENHDGTVDKKKTSLYLHFVNPEDNTIIEVDKVLTLIDNNIEYLDELYKEFHVLSSEAAHLPLSSSALIDPVDQIKTGLLGVSSFLALILVLVIALCLNQRTRYERQLKAATVSAFGSSPLHLDPDFHSQSNLPNTNLHSQDPNPIWMNGYSEQDWLSGKAGACLSKTSTVPAAGDKFGAGTEDGDYLSSENSDLNSLNGVNCVSQMHYNVATTATPRDSLNSSQGRVSGSGSGSTSTTNDQQALCRNNGRQTPQPQHHQQQLQRVEIHHFSSQQQAARPKEPKVIGVLKNGKAGDQSTVRKRSQLAAELNGNSTTHSTFGAFKEVTIYTDHNPQTVQPAAQLVQHQKQQVAGANNLVRTVGSQQPRQQQPSQVNKIASQLNAKHQAQTQLNQVYLNQAQCQGSSGERAEQRILVHSNGADVNQGIIKAAPPVQKQAKAQLARQATAAAGSGAQTRGPNGNVTTISQPQNDGSAAENFETNLSKLSILNLETTEL